jgi:uncharacterized membrane protein
MPHTGRPAAAATTRQRPRGLVGIDAVRGLALIGMIAVHVLPVTTDDGRPSWSWTLASGSSAALFVLAAGVSLALAAGGRNPARGAELKGAQAGTSVTAVLLILLGLLLGVADPPAGIIVAYYGVMVLLTVPLLGAGPGTLFTLMVAFAVLGGAFLHVTGSHFPDLRGYDPSLVTLFTHPGPVLSTLAVTGTFPVLAWMTFMCAGLGLGRLTLRRRDTQLRLIVGGLLTVGITWLVSFVARDVLGGFERIVEDTEGLTEDALARALTYGEGFSTPEITSGWWLLMLSPYSETPLDVLHTLGWAVLILGAMLLVGSRITWLADPLALLGTMALTLYSAHLLFLSTHLLEDARYLSFWLRLGVALLFAVLWRNVTEQSRGPVELGVARASERARDRAVARALAHARRG